VPSSNVPFLFDSVCSISNKASKLVLLCASKFLNAFAIVRSHFPIAGTLSPMLGRIEENSVLTWLGSLGHLDLQLVRVGQVIAGHPEPAAGHLLDGAPLGVLAAILQGLHSAGVFAPLPGVGLAAQLVHGHGQRGVGLQGDRPVAHGTWKMDRVWGFREERGGAES
jgi:hypothetical protein